MSFLNDLIPQNLNEEKEKFFADNKYNPQFIYKTKIDKEKLTQHGKPLDEYLNLADNVLKKTFFGRNELDIEIMEGNIISHRDVEKTILTFLKMHDLQKRFKMVWSKSFIPRTSITSDTIKLRLPADFRKQSLLGMLYHEIGTHALRRVNYEKQPWYKKKEKFGFKNYLLTEEGLAVLHSLLPHTYKSAYKSAIRYKAVSLSQKYSFVETFEMLKKYVNDPEKRWTMTLRQKRGIQDTSLPGGYSKDLMYFEGMIKVYIWLQKNNFDITPLYFGKIAYEDVQKAVEINKKFQPKLPVFFSLNREKYSQEIKKIGEFNDF